MAVRYLSQVLGIQKDISRRAENELTRAYQLVPVAAAFEGLRHTYEPLIEETDKHPDNVVRVQHTVKELIAGFRDYLADEFDIIATRDYTNGPQSTAGPVADVVIGGAEVLLHAPVHHLLWLEGQLKRLRNFVEKVPTLPPTTSWDLEDAERGIYVSNPPVKSFRQERRPQWKIIAPEGKFAAQTAHYEAAETVGEWTKVVLSGAIRPEAKVAMMARIEAAMTSVVAAQRVANQVEIVEIHYGAGLMTHLFG